MDVPGKRRCKRTPRQAVPLLSNLRLLPFSSPALKGKDELLISVLYQRDLSENLAGFRLPISHALTGYEYILKLIRSAG